MMDQEGFRRFLEQRGASTSEIDKSVTAVKSLEGHLDGSIETATAGEIRDVVDRMIKSGENTQDAFVGIARYGMYVGNEVLFGAFFEILEASDVLETLYKIIADEAGEETRNAVFKDIELPPLGTAVEELPAYTARVMKSMQSKLPAAVYQKALYHTRHGLPQDFRGSEREKYLAAESLDKYIESSRSEFLELLKKHCAEKTLFFGQEITDKVVEFVRSDPEISGVRRDGDTLYKTKIPYMPKRYLEAADPVEKRFYACHCSWARHSIHAGGAMVSEEFCHCSAGFVAQPWEKALDTELEVEILESVLAGDQRCRFAIRLPQTV